MAFSGSSVLLSRLSGLKTVIRNGNNTGSVLSSAPHRLAVIPRLYAISVNEEQNKPEIDGVKKETISKAMKAYLERAQQHDEFMKQQNTEYLIGKRHLANMMGEDPETFTQADVDTAIKYLFPSGLFDPRARPLMRPPEEVFPQRKAAEFDESGRPHHTMFYTGKPNYYQLLYDIVEKLNELNRYEDKMLQTGVRPNLKNTFDMSGSIWQTKVELEKSLVEELIDKDYDCFVVAMQRLAEHPYSHRMADFIMKYRKTLMSQTKTYDVPKLQFDADGRPFIVTKDCMRKSARGVVTVRGNGSGKITINGQDISYFTDIQCREQWILNFCYNDVFIPPTGDQLSVC